MNKFCVFCGKPPEDKNKEHILPKWLIKLTGDPKRVVKFGNNYSTGKEIRFDWENFTVPSCTKCNSKYSELENEIKPIIDKLLKKKEIKTSEAIKLLDWLDKIRIGLWINYYYLKKNIARINPRLFVENRIGKKDRFMQIHFLKPETASKGLNAFGVETLSFQFNPSCIGLKINNILIINGSNDFLISENCGFPFPKKIKASKSEMLSLSDWVYNRSVSQEISSLKLFKGVLTLLQPIHTEINYKANFFDDSYLILNCIDREKRIGTVFRFSNSDVIPIFDLETKLKYEAVKESDVKFIGELISKVYEGQNTFLSRVMAGEDKLLKKTIELNNKRIDFYKNYHERNFA